MEEKKDFVKGVDYYLENGYVIFTEKNLKEKGECCGNKCRHCPYDPFNVRGTTTVKNNDTHTS
jgi:hypothetical protein